MSEHPVDYFQYHQALLIALYQFCCTQLPFVSDQASDTDQAFLQDLQKLSTASQHDDAYQVTGQALLSRIVANYAHITPHVSRDLFWFFGGDCLHFLSDEEITNYQKLDEILYEAETSNQVTDYPTAKAMAFKLH